MSDSDPQLVPTLTASTPKRDQVAGQGDVSNGTPDIRKTHPLLWRAVMAYAAICGFLGLNFIFFHPAFLLYHQSNYWWGAIFLILCISKIVFLNLYRNLHLMRVTMACEVSFMLFLALGATEPVWTSSASLQLPILYIGLAILEIPLILEPFVNPWTARRD
jgi:hypothetical protein